MKRVVSVKPKKKKYTTVDDVLNGEIGGEFLVFIANASGAVHILHDANSEGSNKYYWLQMDKAYRFYGRQNSKKEALRIALEEGQTVYMLDSVDDFCAFYTAEDRSAWDDKKVRRLELSILSPELTRRELKKKKPGPKARSEDWN